MAPTIPFGIYALSLGANIVICGLLLFGLFQGLAAADLPPARKTRFGLIASIGRVVWLYLAAEMARDGDFEARHERVNPIIAQGTGLTIVLGLLAIRYSVSLRAVLRAIPIHRLIAVQVYRALGLMFPVAYGVGLLPGVFAWPAGIGDIAVGLLAPLVAWRAMKHPGRARNAVWAWSLLSIGDLILALSLGFLSSPSRFQMIALGEPGAALSAYPLVMVPIFAVPVSILLHAGVISKLRAARPGASAATPSVAV